MIFGTHADNTLEQFENIRKGAVKAALMADGHFGHIMPVGGVAAYENQVSVNGVGYDIACGNCAIKTDIHADDLLANQSGTFRENATLNRIADLIAATISFGVGRSNYSYTAPVDHPLFESDAWNAVPAHFRNTLRAKARQQLGTVGSGNHYVDVFVDTKGFLWVGVHFGSRGLGHTIASNFLAIGQGGNWGDKHKEAEVLLDIRSGDGAEYWKLMELAGEYAYAGREWVARTVVDILGGKEVDLVHNHHNFAWKETHDGQDLIVVRKGATPAFPGQRGFVGGSMGDNAVILEGARPFFAATSITGDGGKLDIEKQQRDAMHSTVHGAGRVMSRTEAAGKRDRKTGELKINKETGEVSKHGKVSPEMMNAWLVEKDVILRGGGLDESPHAYRRLPDVLAAQGNTITVLETLQPIIVVMAGDDITDPYKD